jgi:hypothetical protein
MKRQISLRTAFEKVSINNFGCGSSEMGDRKNAKKYDWFQDQRILRYGGACNWCNSCDRYVGDGLTCERDSCGHSWDVHA